MLFLCSFLLGPASSVTPTCIRLIVASARKPVTWTLTVGLTVCKSLTFAQYNICVFYCSSTLYGDMCAHGFFLNTSFESPVASTSWNQFESLITR